MINKVAGLARALAIVLAIVAAFVAIPVQVPIILLVLGLVAGLLYAADDFVRLGVFALVLPLAGAAVGMLPAVGTQLAAILANVGIAVGGILVTRIVLRLYETLVGDLKGLAG